MATRDLTSSYMRLRSAMHRKAPRTEGFSGYTEAAGSAPLAGGAAGAGPDFSSLSAGGAASPVYVDFVNQINQDILAIQAKLPELRRAHDDRLRIGFDPSAEAEKDREIEILTGEVKRLFVQASGRIKRVTAYQSDADANEVKLRQNIQRGLATRLSSLNTDFRGLQKAYIASMQRMSSGASFAALLGGAGGAAGEDRDLGFTDEQMHELASAEEDVDERMRAIQRVARSVEELATLFNELNTLVIEQGTMLDRIDYNMEQAVESVKAGVVELKQAEEYQKSARPIKCMLLLMLLIIICVIIIIVKSNESSSK